MYDPWVVDGFISVYPEIAEKAQAAGQQARSVLLDRHDVGYGAVPTAPVTTPTDSEIERGLGQARARLGGCPNEETAFRLIGQYVGRLANADGCAFFSYLQSTNVLKCTLVTPDYESLRGQVLRPGEGVSGWVWVQQRTIVNANASVELPPSVGTRTESKSALSTTVVSKLADPPIGVLTAYAFRADAFSRPNTYAFEELSKLFGAYLSDRIHVV
jgi:hypothetical protein